MEIQNTEEAIRREACEKVKQIVKAIKAIKIKYYMISKISEKDQEAYQKLENHLEQISESHNLNNLKEALMDEIDKRYGNGGEHEPDDILQKCYGAIDAQKEAISKGRIAQAIRCQEQLKKYKEQLDEAGCKEVTNYKREKFAELMQTREQVEEQIKSWNNAMKGMYKIKHVEKRTKAMQTIQKAQNKELQKDKEADEETIVI